MKRYGLPLLCLLFAAPAWAESNLRCAESIIQRGFTFYEVEERCGPPVFEYSRTVYRYPGYLVDVDEWVYELGRNRYRRQLTFENGRLRRIETRSKPKKRLSKRYVSSSFAD
ncbi:MAG: DUF2845 domain-containing protein [Pseudomonadales bacterium]